MNARAAIRIHTGEQAGFDNTRYHQHSSPLHHSSSFHHLILPLPIRPSNRVPHTIPYRPSPPQRIISLTLTRTAQHNCAALAPRVTPRGYPPPRGTNRSPTRTIAPAAAARAVSLPLARFAKGAGRISGAAGRRLPVRREAISLVVGGCSDVM